MSQGASVSARETQNGHGGQLTGASAAETDRPQAESPIGQAHAEAEELLSRAQVHAELLRAHAETARAEAESLRAEAAALRRAARDEAAAVDSRAEALLAQVHATAAELRSAMELQAQAARAEVERLRTEAVSLRRLLQEEIDAALAKLRAQVQVPWAETDKLGAELDRPDAERPRAGSVTEPEVASDGPLDDLRRSIVAEVDRRLAVYAETGDRRAKAEVKADERDPDPDPVPVNVGTLLREIWDAASTESARLSDPGFPGEAGHPAPNGAGPDRPRASQPLIGSGGWRSSAAKSSAAAPMDDPRDGKGGSPPPGAGRPRRFRRPA